MRSDKASTARSRRLVARALSLAFLLAVSSEAVHAAAPAGAWRIDIQKPFGVTIHTFLVLHDDGGTITGSVFPNGSRAIPILDALPDGADIRFRIEWGWVFRVRPEGDKLRVSIAYGGGGRDEALAVAVPEESLHPHDVEALPVVRDLPENGLAKTPPMGWNSWNHFAESVDDQVVRDAADALVSSGMAAAGYVYVNIDDTWEGGRDALGNIVPNRKFPDMKALADYVHLKGLKFGIYTSPGPVTCDGYAGSYGHEEQDARTFASWGVDYLKYDWCSAGNLYTDAQARAVYQRMGEAIEHCGRPMVYCLCPRPVAEPWKWGSASAGNLWRTAGDISDNWRRMSELGFGQERLAPYAGPGHWNDPDILEVGNGGMSATEYRTHFSLWCMLAAPLLAGNDLRAMSPATVDILTNREAIAVDQDALGRQGGRLLAKDGLELWAKPLRDGGRALAVFNRGEAQATGSFSWQEAGLRGTPSALRDLWLHKDLDPAEAGLRADVPAHGVVMLVVR